MFKHFSVDFERKIEIVNKCKKKKKNTQKIQGKNVENYRFYTNFILIWDYINKLI